MVLLALFVGYGGGCGVVYGTLDWLLLFNTPASGGNDWLLGRIQQTAFMFELLRYQLAKDIATYLPYP